MVFGLWADLGATSAVANKAGEAVNLNFEEGMLSGVNLQSVSFEGAFVTSSFNNWMDWVSFKGATLRGNVFTNATLRDMSFDNAVLDGVVFQGNGTGNRDRWSLKGASLSNVVIDPLGDTNSYFNFTGASLNSVYIPNGTYFDFTNAKIKDSYIRQDPAATAIYTNTVFTGELFLNLFKNGIGASGMSTFNNVIFVNAKIVGDNVGTTEGGIDYATFNTCKFLHTTIDHAKSAAFNNCTFSNVQVTGSLYLATFVGSTGHQNIYFYAGARCPNGTYAATSGWGSAVCSM